MKVTLYTKPGCRLCAETEVLLRRLRRKTAFELDFVNIEEDESAYGRYWDRIPVVVVDGQEVARAPVDEETLKAAINA